MEWIYSNNHDNSCRYMLGVAGKKPLICVGVNPSTAEPDHLDNTLKSVARIAEAQGYDSWLMVNLYPQRATDPNDMAQIPDEQSIVENLRFIEQITLQYPDSDIWAAWGTLIIKRAYLADCFSKINEIVSQSTCRWVSFGAKSKQGHPHHPLYLKATALKESFDAATYAKTIEKRAN